MTQINDSFTQTITVLESHTAKALGSGKLDVLSTPYMIACMENTAMKLADASLTLPQDTVGTFIKVYHNKAALVGNKITYTAIVTDIENRKITFKIEAVNEKNEQIGTSIHERFIVDSERFMKKLTDCE